MSIKPGDSALSSLGQLGTANVTEFPEAPKDRKRDEPKQRFSVTSDIISFRRCPRQYGFFAHRGFTPARAAQLYFGTVVHQVLNRIHNYFAGLETAPKGSIPTDERIREYVEEVDLSLRLQGIKPMSRQAKEQIVEYLTAFNSKWGKELYPRIVDTERRLEREEGGFILQGVVDVLARTADRVDHDRANPSELEIWDYKGSRLPRQKKGSQRGEVDRAHPDLKNYEFQMCVYAHLYQQATGRLPRRAVLWFLSEPKREDAEYEVTFTAEKIQAAMDSFSKTVRDIIKCKETDSWAVPAVPPEEDTCNACDFRWSCPHPERTYKPPIY